MNGKILTVRNPRNGEFDYQITTRSAAEVAESVDAIRAAQPAWEALGIQGRSEVLRRWAVEVEKCRDQLADALAVDTGRYLISRNEAYGVSTKINNWCNKAGGMLMADERVSTVNPNVVFSNQYIAYQVVGVISPWNFPLSLALIDALPALVAGCGVALKPSEVTPRFIEPLQASIERVPELAAIFQVLPGDGETGAALVNEVDMVCFTGSVATGRKVAASAGHNFIPAHVELGGKDPAVVVAGADLERATDAILRQGMVNAGQVCLSLERVYVQDTIFDEFLEKLVAKARKVEINYPDIHQGHIGPLIFERQAEIIEAHLEDAIALGAKVHCGGKVENFGGGKWCRPTVLSQVDHRMKIMTEETFGPILSVAKFSTIDEAVELSNDSDYGLSGAVFAATDEEALAVAQRINCGGMSINDAGLQSVTTECEKNAFNFSGLGGSRMGPAGFLRFFRKKALMVQKGYPRTIENFSEI